MAAVPENLIESELFGHVKGAFTGALESRNGRFQAADGGTLFIDEIGDFAPASQAKLLRVLETSFVTKVGSNEGHEVDVRVVAATSRNLAELVERGKFRGDLFYRLNVIQLRLPALRARRDDIPMLVKHFLREKSVLVGREVPSVSDELMEFLCRYDWPGNIRQLANCLESMVVLADDEMLQIAHLPPDIREGQGGSQGRVMIPPGTTLEQLEQVAIRETLKEYQGTARKRRGRWELACARCKGSSTVEPDRVVLAGAVRRVAWIRHPLR